MADNTEKFIEVRFDTLSKPDNISLTGKLWAFDSHSEWEFSLYQHGTRQFVLQNTSLNELIELILLGKLHKAQLQAMGKKEPVLVLCDLCGKPTTGQNPHYDCEQREAYLANNPREVLDNG